MTGAALVLAVTAGCLPEDTVLALKFAPDGQKLAVASEKAGLRVVDPTTYATTDVVNLRIDPAAIEWIGNDAIAYAAAPEGSLDVFITSLDRTTTRVTSSPSRETFPLLASDALLHLTTESGVAELTSHSLSGGQPPAIPLRLPQLDGDMIHPTLAPDGHSLAFFTFRDLIPRLCVTDLRTGKLQVIDDSDDPFRLRTDALAWSSDSLALTYLHNGPAEGALPEDAVTADPRHDGLVGRRLMVWRRGDDGGTNLVNHAGAARIGSPRLLDSTALVYTLGEKLHSWLDFYPPTRTSGQHLLDLDLPVTLPATGGHDGTIAFVAADQLIGLTTGSLQSARVLTFDLQEKFLLAEAYFRSGRSSKSYDLYEELAASVTRTRDPQMARFIYIANLRRLGRTKQAVAELEKLVQDDSATTQTVPRRYLWRLLGFSYLLELDDLPRARTSFDHYRSLTSDTAAARTMDSALNALQILERNDPELTRLYGRGVKARLEGDFTAMSKLFGDLLTSGAELAAVRREYIKALDGFDAEVYYFTPSQRPFQPSRSQRAAYLQRFVDRVSTTSELARQAKLDLFLLRIEMGNYTRARELLREALSSGPDDGRPEGILEVFRNYLETPEPQPWINPAIPEVFLHPEIRPLLMDLVTDPGDRLLIAVAATKMALLQEDPERARQEANAAGAEWNRLDPHDQSGEMAMLYGRLLVLRAREAELRGLYAEATDGYMLALKLLEEKQTADFEFQEEIRYRAALLRMLVADYPDLIPRLQTIEEKTGSELVNPTWDANLLQDGGRHLVELYQTTSSTQKLWAAYEAGVCFGKLRLPEQSRAAMLIAASDASPAFLQRKAVLELAALDEYLNDPWNAARWFARLAAMPGTSDHVRLWCSYQIARLHLSMGYKIAAAREALAVIVSTRPDSPLSIQAQELLVSTDIR